MRLCLLAPLLFLCALVQAAPPGVQGWTELGLRKVFRDDPPGAAREIRLAAARGETEWAQVVLRSDQPAPVTLSASPLASPHAVLPTSCLVFHPAVYVHVSRPSGNDVRPAGYWPEVLPIGDMVTLTPGQNQPVYIAVHVPEDARPGLYRTTIRCATAGSTFLEVPVRVVVWPLLLPRTPTVRTSYYIWWDGIQQRFGLVPGTRQWRATMDRFFWFLIEHRLGPMSLPVDIHQGAPYLNDPRVNGVRLPYLGSDAELAGVIRFVKQRGWLSRCFYYLNDEPPKRVWPEVWAAANRLHGFDPLTPTLDTVQPEPGLQGAVSIWCPNVESVYLHEDAIAQARARGEEVWWYTCCVPKAPYPTFLLDDDAIAPRLLFWSQPRYDLTGSLYINTIHWGPEGNDIWAEAAVSPELLANNDGLILYTGRATTLADAHPVTGVRLEMIRDGLEDVELLNLLRAAIVRAAQGQGRSDGPQVARAHLAALASQVMPDLRTCDRDPTHLLRWRQRAAEETLRLQAHPEDLDEVLALPLRRAPKDAPEVTPEKFCVALPGTPVVDGKLDDPCWTQVAAANRPGRRTLITRFRNLTGLDWPSQLTVVSWLYDRDNLYCGFRCGEPESAKLRTLATAGDLAGADRVAVGLRPDEAQARWYVVTADGTQLEGKPDRAAPVTAPTWQGKVVHHEEGYEVEFALPRKWAGPDPQPAFNLFRYSAPGDETLYMTGRFAARQSPWQFGRLFLGQQ